MLKLTTDPTTQQQAPADPALASPPVRDGTAGAAESHVKPDGLDDRFFDPKAGVKWGELTKEFGELAAFRSEAEASKPALPANADEYKIEFPDDFEAPEGFQVDEKSPLWQQGREMAHKAGFTQEQFKAAAATMVNILANQEISAEGHFAEYAKAESAKLGANAAAMSDAVVQWVEKSFSPEAAKVLGESRVLVNAEVLKGFTEVMRSVSSGGVSSLNASGRQSARETISDEDWARMPFAEKMRVSAGLQARN